MLKKICFITLGIVLMIFGLYGLFVWWWPLFVQLFLGSLGIVVFIIGLGVFIAGLVKGPESQVEEKEAGKKVEAEIEEIETKTETKIN